MNKKIISFLIIFFAVFMFLDKCNAATSQTYTDRVDWTVTVNKNLAELTEDSIGVSYHLGTFPGPTIYDKIAGTEIEVYLFTTTSDLVYKSDIEDNLWWETLYMCLGVDSGFGAINADYVLAVYTDVLSTSVTSESGLEALGFIPNTIPLFGEGAKCHTLNIQKGSVPEENLVNTCDRYAFLSNKINQSVIAYTKTKNSAYKTEYTNQLSYLKSSCKKATAFADYNDACVRRCGLLKNDINYWEKELYPNRGTPKCGFSARIIFWIRNILKWIKYILPVFVIVLGMLDFLKALSGDKNEELKKAQGKFIKRLIAAALTFIIPLIIVFILDKMGFGDYVDGCGIVDI